MEVKEEWIEGMVDEEGVRTPRSFGASPPSLCSGQALLKGGVSEAVLHHASGDSDFFVGWDIFEFSGDFIFGFLADGAGIKDDDISFFFCFTVGKSAVEEDGFDSGGVGVVHLASEGDDVERGHKIAEDF